MCPKILLVALLLSSLLSGLVSATNGATKGSGEACHDNWNLNECARLKSLERCDMKRIARNCQKTCGLCEGMCTAHDYTPYKGCGLAPKGSRIIGGDDVSPHSIPWQIGLLFADNLYESIECGGTLLTEKHALTAAHCTFDQFNNTIEASDILAVVAEHAQYNFSDGIVHEIRSYTNHPQYNLSAPYDYDFSMLHLTVPVNFGDRAVPACLPDLLVGKLEDKLVGKYLTVSGWGLTGNPDHDGFPDLLQSVDVPVVSQDDCKMAYLNARPLKITNAMICAGYPTGEKDSCGGDSGGPLTYKENGRSYLIGVVSYGVGCALAEYPGVYARVTTVLDWINKELRASC